MATSSLSRRRPVVWLIAACLIGLLPGPLAPAGSLAQGSGTVVVGSSSIAFSGGWTLQASNGSSVFLRHDGEGALFNYNELADGMVPVSDNDLLIETKIMPIVRDVEGFENVQMLSSGNLQDGTRWHSYTLLAEGTPSVFLVTGNTQALPGADVLMTLLVSQDRLGSALTAVAGGITANGAPTSLSAIPVDSAPGQGVQTPGTTPTPAAVDPSTSHVTGTGQTITWAPPWALAPERTLATPGYDVIYLTDGSAWTIVATGNLSPDAARGLLLGSLGADTNAVASLDQGGDGTTSYWFEQVPIGGASHGAFTLSTLSDTGDAVTMVIFAGPIPTFGTGMADAQASIAIDGAPLFPGIVPDGLQAQLGPAAPAAQANTPAVPAQAFVPAGSWTDPGFGYTLEWAEGWQMIGVRDTNTVMIQTANGATGVQLSAMPREATTPADWAARFVENPGYAQLGVQPETPVINAGNVFVVARGPDAVIVSEMLFLDDGATIVLATLAIFDSADPEPLIEHYRATVRIAGRMPLEGWTAAAQPGASAPPQARAAPGSVSNPAQAFPDLEFADAGMVATGHYISPQYGTTITWTNEWQLNRDAGVPVVTDPASEYDRLHLVLSGDRSAWITIEMFSLSSRGWPTVNQFISDALTEDFVADIYGPGAEIVLHRVAGEAGSMLVRYEEGGAAYWFVVEIRPLAGGAGVIVVEYGTWAPMTIEAELSSALEHIMVDAAPLLTVLTTSEIASTVAARA